MRVPYKAKLLAELPLSTLGVGKTRRLCPGEHASAPRLRVAKPCRGAQRDEGDLLGSDSRNRRLSNGATLACRGGYRPRAWRRARRDRDRRRHGLTLQNLELPQRRLSGTPSLALRCVPKKAPCALLRDGTKYALCAPGKPPNASPDPGVAQARVRSSGSCPPLEPAPLRGPYALAPSCLNQAQSSRPMASPLLRQRADV